MNGKEIEAVIATGDCAQIDAALLELIGRKKQIETQLADDKAAMLEERSRLLQQGVDPRRAQMTATANGDQDWRFRAATALRMIDRDIPKLRQALHVARQRAGITSPHTTRDQKVEVLRGTPEEVAARITDLLPSRQVQHVFTHDGAVIVVHRVLL